MKGKSETRNPKSETAALVTFSEILADQNWVHVLPLGDWTHPWYGDIIVDESDAERYLAHFKEGVVGQTLPVDIEHRSMDPEGAVGWIEDMKLETNGLHIKIDWTDRGTDLLEKKRFRYISAEFAEKYRNNKGKRFKNVFLGAGITTRPFIKTDELEELPQPVEASEGLFITCREPRGEDPSRDREGAGQEGTNMADDIQELREEFNRQLAELRETTEAKDAQIAELTEQVTGLTAERDEVAGELGEVQLREQKAAIEAKLSEKPFPEAHRTRFADLLMRVEDAELREELAEAIAQVEIVDTGERGFNEDGSKDRSDLSARDKKVAAQHGVSEEDLAKYGGDEPDYVADGEDDDED